MMKGGLQKLLLQLDGYGELACPHQTKPNIFFSMVVKINLRCGNNQFPWW